MFAASGNAWLNPAAITISFMPDGTNLGGVQSNLFSTFNKNPKLAGQWQTQILKAAQVWAQQTNINFIVVPDDGAPTGAGSDEEGDPDFGDIRIGGYAFGSPTLAYTLQPPPINNFTLAGDMTFNTAQNFSATSAGGYNLFTVAEHEFGVALGLLYSSASPASVMWPSYNAVKPNLSSDDIAGIRNIYSGNLPRSPDSYEAQGQGTSFASAVNVNSLIDPSANTALVNNLDMTTTSDVDYYAFNAPSNTSGTFSVNVQSSGLSLLSPDLTVYAADQHTVLGSAIGLGQYGTTLTVNVSGAVPGQQYYAVVQGADTTAFSTGRYALALNFGSSPTPTAPSPIIAYPDGNPIRGGGGVADSSSPGDDFLDSVPTVTGISPDNGLSANDGVTDVPQISIQGRAPAGNTVSVYQNGEFIGTTVVGQSPIANPSSSTSTWSFDYTGTTLPDGTYSFTATATDSMGNVSALSFPFQVIINTQTPAAPTIAGVSPVAGSVGSSVAWATAPTLFGTAGPNSEVTVFRNQQVVGTTLADSSGAWNYTSGPLGVGTYAFTTTDTNLAGDVSAPSSAFKLQIGGLAPATTTPLLLSSALGGLFGFGSGVGSATPIFVGMATPGSMVTLFDGTTVLGTAQVNALGFWIFASPTLAAGPQTIFAEATNHSGVTGLASSAVTYTD